MPSHLSNDDLKRLASLLRIVSDGIFESNFDWSYADSLIQLLYRSRPQFDPESGKLHGVNFGGEHLGVLAWIHGKAIKIRDKKFAIMHRDFLIGRTTLFRADSYAKLRKKYGRFSEIIRLTNLKLAVFGFRLHFRIESLYPDLALAIVAVPGGTDASFNRASLKQHKDN